MLNRLTIDHLLSKVIEHSAQSQNQPYKFSSPLELFTLFTNLVARSILEEAKRYPDFYSDEYAETFTDLFRETFSECKRCEACKTRRLVAASDGLLNAKVFILAPPADLLDSSTGITLSGLPEIINSRCGVCLNSPRCYKQEEPLTLPCSPEYPVGQPSPDLQEKIKGDKKINVPPTSPGIPFNRSLRVYKDEFPLHRDNWRRGLRFQSLLPQEEIDRLSAPSPLYITSLVKCPDGDFSSCIEWAILERRLCAAPYTIVLGSEVLEKILPGSSLKANTNLSSLDDPLWKRVYLGDLKDAQGLGALIRTLVESQNRGTPVCVPQMAEEEQE